MRLLLEAATVFDRLRRLVEDAHHFLGSDWLLVNHRGDHDACRGATDGACEQPLGKPYGLGVGGECRRIAIASLGLLGERRAGWRLPKETADQLHEIGNLCRAAPEPALLAPRDRKSTRLNSSHSQISYAVF